MSEEHITRGRVYARHDPIEGAVLIVGAGAVGSSLAEQLAHLGATPLRLVDHDKIEIENIARHELGYSALGQPKASTLANRIGRELPTCDAVGVDADFLKLPESEQLRLVQAADIVIAATDTIECQRRVNEICLNAGVTSVYPSFWVDPSSGTRDAEVGEIFWTAPGQRIPCYSCLTSWRPEETGAAARGGTRADIQIVVLATVWVVAALLDPANERSQVLDQERTFILVHGSMPYLSDAVRDMFRDADDSGFLSFRVPFPSAPCPVCGGHRPQPLVAREEPNRQTRQADSSEQARSALNEIFGTGIEELSATLITNFGNMQIRLFGDIAPMAVRNFIQLARGDREYTDPGTGQPGQGPYYNGTLFHRVISGFMIQGGGQAGGGWSGPGYQFNDEIHPNVRFDRPYLLAMANTGPNTNGSQFLITAAVSPHLDNRHTIFGEVADAASRQVVDTIASVRRTPTDHPVQDVVIERVVIETRPLGTPSPQPTTMPPRPTTRPTLINSAPTVFRATVPAPGPRPGPTLRRAPAPGLDFGLVIPCEIGEYETAATLKGAANQIGKMIRDGEPGSSPAVVDLSPRAIEQIMAELRRRRVAIRPPVILKRDGRFSHFRTSVGIRAEVWLYPVESFPDTAIALRHDSRAGNTAGGGGQPGPVAIVVLKTMPAGTPAFEKSGRGELVVSAAMHDIVRRRRFGEISIGHSGTKDLKEPIPPVPQTPQTQAAAPAYQEGRWITGPDGRQVFQPLNPDELGFINAQQRAAVEMEAAIRRYSDPDSPGW